MKLYHLVAINHNPPEIREEYPNFAEYERVLASLMKRYETVFKFREFNGRRDERPLCNPS